MVGGGCQFWGCFFPPQPTPHFGFLLFRWIIIKYSAAVQVFPRARPKHGVLPLLLPPVPSPRQPVSAWGIIHPPIRPSAHPPIRPSIQPATASHSQPQPATASHPSLAPLLFLLLLFFFFVFVGLSPSRALAPSASGGCLHYCQTLASLREERGAPRPP